MKFKYTSEVSTERYKNIDLEQGLKPSAGLSIFTGSNGSGKNRLITLLKFLKDCISDNISSERNGVTNFIRAVAEAIRLWFIVIRIETVVTTKL